MQKRACLTLLLLTSFSVHAFGADMASVPGSGQHPPAAAGGVGRAEKDHETVPPHQETAHEKVGPQAKALLFNVDGEQVGKIDFTQFSGSVKMDVGLSSAPGLYTVRLLDVGKCEVENGTFAVRGKFLGIGGKPVDSSEDAVRFPDFLVGSGNSIKISFAAESAVILEEDRVLSPTGAYLDDEDGTSVLVYMRSETVTLESASDVKVGAVDTAGKKEDGQPVEKSGGDSPGVSDFSSMQPLACGVIASDVKRDHGQE